MKPSSTQVYIVRGPYIVSVPYFLQVSDINATY